MPGTLVIQPLPGIGDMVWHLPCLRAIAETAPDGRITVLTKRRSLADQLFAETEWVGDIMWLERARGESQPGRHDRAFGVLRLARDLRSRGFDTVWILHNSWRYAWAGRLAGIPHRVGVRDLPGADRRRPLSEKAASLLAAQGLRIDRQPRFEVSDRARGRIERQFADLPRPWLAFGIGASEPFKQWGGENFAALARATIDRTGGSVFLIGGRDEQALARRIAERARRPVHPVLGMPLGDVAALCASCRAFVGNDTGTLNLAAATGIDCVGLFGGSPPLTLYPRLRPLVPQTGALYRLDRMAEIPVEAAMQALNAIFEPAVRGRPRPPPRR